MIRQTLNVRPWALALCAALSVGSIAACGSDKEKKSDTESTAAATTGATHPTTSTQSTTSSTQTAPSFDLSQFEAKVAQQLSGAGAGAQAGGTTTHVTEVQCPDSTTPTAGEGVDCDAMGDGGLTGNVTITFNDDTGQAYSYKAKLQIGNTTQNVSGSVTGK